MLHKPRLEMEADLFCSCKILYIFIHAKKNKKINYYYIAVRNSVSDKVILCY